MNRLFEVILASADGLCLFISTLIQLAPTGSPSLVNSMKIIENPVKTCDKVYALIQSLTSQIRKRLEDPKSAGEWIIALLRLGWFKSHIHRSKFVMVFPLSLLFQESTCWYQFFLFQISL